VINVGLRCHAGLRGCVGGRDREGAGPERCTMHDARCTMHDARTSERARKARLLVHWSCLQTPVDPEGSSCGRSPLVELCDRIALRAGEQKGFHVCHSVKHLGDPRRRVDGARQLSGSGKR
jgi:hypothetical protein